MPLSRSVVRRSGSGQREQNSWLYPQGSIQRGYPHAKRNFHLQRLRWTGGEQQLVKDFAQA